MKILIVDDDFASRIVFIKALKDYGSCNQVVNGIEAVDAFLAAWNQKVPYDLIILDIMMPKLGGLDALKIIRQLEKEMGVEESNQVNIIMASVLNDEATVRSAFERGCQAYAAKPVNLKAFGRAVEELALCGKPV